MSSVQGALPSSALFAALLCVPPALFLLVCLRRHARIRSRRGSGRGMRILASLALAGLVVNAGIAAFLGPVPLRFEALTFPYLVGFGLSWLSLWGWIIVGARQMMRRRYVI